jgi:2-C-methyl-D-erythritol 4-phosphate cytidylyltransferase
VTAALVLLAAGSGTRTGLATNKVFATLGGRSVLGWSLLATRAEARFGPVVLVVRADEVEAARQVLADEDPGRDARVVVGGSTRHASEWSALQALAGDVRAGRVDVVAIHDAARPLASPELFASAVDTARLHGGAVPGRVQTTLLHRGSLHPYAGDLVGVQTPQAFRAGPLLAAYAAAEQAGFEGTDTAACLERFAPELVVAHLPAPPSNLKITFAQDLAVAERLLAQRRP